MTEQQVPVDANLLDRLLDDNTRRTVNEVLVAQRGAAPASSIGGVPLPRKFTGGISDKPWRYWISDLREFGTATNSTDERLAALLSQLLDGSALAKYRQLKQRRRPPQTLDDWDREMEAAFSFDRTADFHMEQLRLLQFAQHHLSVDQLATKVRESASIAIETDSERERIMNYTFIYSLPKEIRTRVVDGGDKIPAEFEDSVARAQKVELNIEKEKLASNAATAFGASQQQRPATTTDLQRLLSQLSVNGNSVNHHTSSNNVNGRNQNGNRGRQPFRQPFQGPGRGRRGFQRRGGRNGRQGNGDWRANNDGRNLCFRCRSADHHVRNCPLPPPGEANPIANYGQGQQFARGRGYFNNQQRNFRGNGGNRFNRNNRVAAAATANDDEPEEFFVYDDPVIEAAFAGHNRSATCMMVTALAAPNTGDSDHQRSNDCVSAATTDVSGKQSSGGYNASGKQSSCGVNASGKRSASGKHTVCGINASGKRGVSGKHHNIFWRLLYRILFAILLNVLFKAALCGTNANANRYFVCPKQQFGQLYEPPKPLDCTAPPLNGSVHFTSVNIWLPNDATIQAPAIACSLRTRTVCTSYDWLFAKTITQDKQASKPVSPDECKESWDAKSFQGQQLRQASDGIWATDNKVAIDYQYLTDLCFHAENLVVREGHISSNDGQSCHTSLGNANNCHFLAGKCTNDAATLLWTPTTEAPPCPFEFFTNSDAAVNDNYVIIEQLQLPLLLTRQVTQCGETFKATSANLLLQFPQQKSKRSTNDDDPTSAELEYMTNRARARQKQFQYEQLAAKNVSGFNVSELHKHQAALNMAYDSFEKVRDWLTTTTTRAATAAPQPAPTAATTAPQPAATAAPQPAPTASAAAPQPAPTSARQPVLMPAALATTAAPAATTAANAKRTARPVPSRLAPVTKRLDIVPFAATAPTTTFAPTAATLPLQPTAAIHRAAFQPSPTAVPEDSPLVVAIPAQFELAEDQSAAASAEADTVEQQEELPFYQQQPAAFIEAVKARKFSNLWQSLCSQKQALFHMASALLQLSPTIGARFLLQRQDIQAAFVGEALAISQCSYVNVSQIHWSYKYRDQCFDSVPVTTTNGLFFIVAGTNELTQTSQAVPCDSNQPGVYHEFKQWRSPTSTVALSRIDTAFLFPSRVRNNSSLSHSPAPVGSSSSSPTSVPTAVQRLRAVEILLQRLIQFTVQFSASPDSARATIRGIVQTSVQQYATKGQFNFSSPILVNAEDMIQAILSGKFQAFTNIAVLLALCLLFLLAMLHLLRKLFRQARRLVQQQRSHNRRDGNNDGPAIPLLAINEPPQQAPAASPTALPRSIGQLLLDAQRQYPRRYGNLPALPPCDAPTAATAALLVAIVGSNFRSPIINVELNNCPLPAMLDTGASINLLNEKTFNTMLADLQKAPNSVPVEVQQCNQHVLTVDGKQLQTAGRIWLNVTVNKGKDIQLTVPFTVVKDLEAPSILGVDFLSRYSQTLFNWRDKFVRLGNLRIPMQGTVFTPKQHRGYVSVAATVEVPARTRAIICGSVLRPYDAWPELAFTPDFDFEENNNVMCQHGAVAPCSTESGAAVIPIEVTNATNVPVTLHKGVTIGKVSTYTAVRQEAPPSSGPPKQPKLTKAPAASIKDIKLFQQKAQEIISSDCQHLSPQQQHELKQLLTQYINLFARDEHDIGFTDVVTHTIPTTDDSPVCVPPYKISMADRPEIDRHVDAMLKSGIIEPAGETAFNSPIFLVQRKPSGTRWICDFRALNAKTILPAFQPLPPIDSILASLGESKFFTLVDQAFGFFQLAVHEKDRHKTAFSTYSGDRYVYRRMAFGLAGAPHSFQKCMNAILSGLNWRTLLCYLDDVLIFSKSWQEHLRCLDEVFQRLLQSGLKLRLEKCRFAQSRIKYLGYEISDQGLRPDPGKVSDVLNFQLGPESTVKDIQSFMGLCQFFKRFIRGFAGIAVPLTNLTRKENSFIWTPECQAAFEQLKQELTSPPTLMFPNFSKRFILMTDASQFAIGGILLQEDSDGQIRPIAYASKKLSPTQCRYATIEREALAVSEMLRHFRYIIHRQETIVFTDHEPLTHLLRKKPGGILDSPRLTRWALAFQADNVKIRYLCGKKNPAADFLSRIQSSLQATANSDFSCNCVICAVGQSPSNEESQSLQQRQKADPFAGPLLAYILNGELPPTDVEARKVILLPERHTVIDDILLEIVPDTTNDLRVVVPRSSVVEILFAHHDAVLGGGHFGIGKTYAKIKASYVWPNMYADVRKYVLSCHGCQTAKKASPKPNPVLNPIEATRPMELIGMDFWSSGQTSARGNRYVLLLICHFTKHVEAFCLPREDAVTTAKTIVQEFICRYGCAERFLSDRGGSFTGDVMREMAKICNIKQSFTVAYHPQTNAITERQWRTLSAIFRQYSGQYDWDDYLKFAVFAYNSTPQSTTKATPFELMFGRSPLLPTEAAFNFKKSPYLIDPDSYLVVMQENLATAFRAARENATLARQQQKEQHDRKATTETFETGDEVLLLNFATKQGDSRKLQRPYGDTIFIVEKVRFPNLQIKSGKIIKTVNVSQVRKYINRAPATTPTVVPQSQVAVPPVPAPVTPSVLTPANVSDQPMPTTIPSADNQEGADPQPKTTPAILPAAPSTSTKRSSKSQQQPRKTYYMRERKF